MYFAYGISSLVRDYIYAGMTKDVPIRFKQHQKGKNRSTRAYRPFQLIYVEQFETRMEARKKEKFLKSGMGKEFLKEKREQAKM
jgi:putative endonuclease